MFLVRWAYALTALFSNCNVSFENVANFSYAIMQSPKNSQSLILVGPDLNKQAILGHCFFDLETLWGICSEYETSRELLGNVMRNHKSFVLKALVVLMQAHSSPHRMPAG